MHYFGCTECGVTAAGNLKFVNTSTAFKHKTLKLHADRMKQKFSVFILC